MRVVRLDGVVVEHISAHLMICITLTAKYVVTFVVGHAPTETAATPKKYQFWSALHATTAQVPTKEPLAIMMGAIAKTGKREANRGPEKARVLDAYGCCVLNDDWERLLQFSGSLNLPSAR